MATANAPVRRSWIGIATLVVLVAGSGVWFYREPIAGYGEAGTAYGAKNACSCRYLAGRSLKSCESDFLPGMEAVFLSEDEEGMSVTAYVPLVAATTAHYREGFGCVLESWDG